MEALLKSIERESEDVAKALEAPDGQMVEVVYKANRVDEEVAKPATPNHIPGTALRVGKEYVVRVKKWMTQEGMDFNINWNNSTINCSSILIHSIHDVKFTKIIINKESSS